MPKTTFSERFAQSIKESGMTQIVISRKLCVSPAAVSVWKLGGKMPNRDRVTRIADVLGVDSLWLESGVRLCPLCVVKAQRNHPQPSSD